MLLLLNVLKRYTLIICLAFVCLFSCKTKQPIHELILTDYGTPPGTIKIADNLYIDQCEVTNLGYLEFLYWTRHIIGEEEYKAMLPDVAGWYALDNSEPIRAKTEYYLAHPAYRNHPVVGISYQQALKFCKWRSDRTMEFILISKGIIPHNINPPKDSVFTIEKYFSGNYYHIKPNPYIKHYPIYSLPDSTTFIKALWAADSLYKKNSKYYTNKKYKDALEIRCLENIPGRCDTLPYGLDPTQGFPDNIYGKKKLIVNLLGNIREFTIDSTKAFGGSYFDSCSTVKSQYFYPAYPKQLKTAKTTYMSYKQINLLDGLRCDCSWKKWEY